MKQSEPTKAKEKSQIRDRDEKGSASELDFSVRKRFLSGTRTPPEINDRKTRVRLVLKLDSRQQYIRGDASSARVVDVTYQDESVLGLDEVETFLLGPKAPPNLSDLTDFPDLKWISLSTITRLEFLIIQALPLTNLQFGHAEFELPDLVALLESPRCAWSRSLTVLDIGFVGDIHKSQPLWTSHCARLANCLQQYTELRRLSLRWHGSDLSYLDPLLTLTDRIEIRLELSSWEVDLPYRGKILGIVHGLDLSGGPLAFEGPPLGSGSLGCIPRLRSLRLKGRLDPSEGELKTLLSSIAIEKLKSLYLGDGPDLVDLLPSAIWHVIFSYF